MERGLCGSTVHARRRGNRAHGARVLVLLDLLLVCDPELRRFAFLFPLSRSIVSARWTQLRTWEAVIRHRFEHWGEERGDRRGATPLLPCSSCADASGAAIAASITPTASKHSIVSAHSPSLSFIRCVQSSAVAPVRLTSSSHRDCLPSAHPLSRSRTNRKQQRGDGDSRHTSRGAP